MFLPRKDFESWAVIAPDRFSRDLEYWPRVERKVGDHPSTLRFHVSKEGERSALEEIRACMYAALESDSIEKLARGFIMTERTTMSGMRRGILACIDLESFTFKEGQSSPVRPAQNFDKCTVQALLAARERLPLEFPHITVLYRDKRSKIMRSLGDDLEQLYDFELMEGGGRLRGYFIPDFVAVEVAEDMHANGDPVFAVSEGIEELVAAKLYWEKLKESLNAEQCENHPSRFALAEFYNIYDEAVRLRPLHRLLADVDAEIFRDYFKRNVKCKEVGGTLTPTLRNTTEAIIKADAVITEFLKRNGGTQYHVAREELQKRANEEDCVAVAFPPPEAEEVFAYIKSGRLLPAYTFTVGEEHEARYALEGREISYD
ncbi:MAG: DUF1015 family protein [Clostridia bacterium]|nr:DUF1015 family protein [Clostridia bacterium]